MAEEQDWSEPPFAKKVYYWPSWNTFWAFFGLIALVSIGAIAYTHGLTLSNWHTRDWVFISASCISAPSLLTFIFYRFGTVVLTPDTICTLNDLSVRQTMPLAEIEKVSRPWYGLGLVLIVKQKGILARLWIPLFLQNKQDFITTLSRVTPPDNPLRAYFDD